MRVHEVVIARVDCIERARRTDVLAVPVARADVPQQPETPFPSEPHAAHARRMIVALGADDHVRLDAGAAQQLEQLARTLLGAAAGICRVEDQDLHAGGSILSSQVSPLRRAERLVTVP